MRVQHNILAMNSYRNYSNNVKALSGNLEKLSSGYKINRAGDDAAGLAISEKMRAQITGLNAAQKNVKDGISLVKTAEGAMQEIQDMLKRMKYLATQSANGTYQDDVDRDNLQKEVESLRSEIDRIADSANFNGINLLDGTWQGKTTLASVQGAGNNATNNDNAKTFEAAPADAGGLTGTKITGLTDAIKSVQINTVADSTPGTGDVDGKAEATISKDGKLTITVTGKADSGTQVTKDNIQAALTKAVADAKTAGNLTEEQATALKDLKIETTVGSAISNSTGTAVTPTETKAAEGGKAARAAAGARTGTDLAFETTDAATIGFKNISIGGLPDTVKKVVISVGDKDGTADADGSAEAALANGTLTITITPKNDSGTTEVDADAIQAAIQGVEGLGSVTFAGEVADSGLKKGSAEATVATDETDKTQNTDKTEGGVKAGEKVEIDLSSIKENFKADETVTIGGKVFKFVAAAGKMARAGGAEDGTADNPFTVTVGADVNASLKNLADKIEANKDTLGVGASFADGKLTLTTTKDFKDAAALKAAVNVTVTGANKDAFEKAWNDAVNEAVKKLDKNNGGNGLKLQIGDTAASYNQLSVEIGDMHTKAMGIDQIDIGDQANAALAIDAIKDAINYVSSVRGDLGAYQNRLDHTLNNLSVMAENIQDAESTIRDTDVAEEMMAYVKNNILVQSAQAMLAQANQVPQGVLQLLG